VRDILRASDAGIDGLVKAGKIAPGSDAELAGMPKPDISSPEALRRMLLAARSISYSNPAVGGTSGVHFAGVLTRLGIAGEMQSKTRFPPPSGFSANLLVSGEVDLAIQQMPELASVAGTELVGPWPGALQLMTTYVAGVPTAASQPDDAKALVRFLQSPPILAVMKAKGLEGVK
jgi:molybdate transport system substrate-binding protein